MVWVLSYFKAEEWAAFPLQAWKSGTASWSWIVWDLFFSFFWCICFVQNGICVSGQRVSCLLMPLCQASQRSCCLCLCGLNDWLSLWYYITEMISDCPELLGVLIFLLRYFVSERNLLALLYYLRVESTKLLFMPLFRIEWLIIPVKPYIIDMIPVIMCKKYIFVRCILI